jgi:hypothetical protein
VLGEHRESSSGWVSSGAPIPGRNWDFQSRERSIYHGTMDLTSSVATNIYVYIYIYHSVRDSRLIVPSMALAQSHPNPRA